MIECGLAEWWDVFKNGDKWGFVIAKDTINSYEVIAHNFDCENEKEAHRKKNVWLKLLDLTGINHR